MSEEKKVSFMEALDLWSDEAIIYPLIYGDPDELPGARSREEIIAEVKKAIREKVLESYKNGLKATPRPGFNKPRRQFSK